MTFVPQIPKKVQFIFNFSFPLVRKLCKKTPLEQFVGGRKGYDRELLFALLLMKKMTNWDYRTIASMAGICHTTLVRTNNFFLKSGIYKKVFAHLVRRALKRGLIKGKAEASKRYFQRASLLVSEFNDSKNRALVNFTISEFHYCQDSPSQSLLYALRALAVKEFPYKARALRTMIINEWSLYGAPSTHIPVALNMLNAPSAFEKDPGAFFTLRESMARVKAFQGDAECWSMLEAIDNETKGLFPTVNLMVVRSKIESCFTPHDVDKDRFGELVKRGLVHATVLQDERKRRQITDMAARGGIDI